MGRGQQNKTGCLVRRVYRTHIKKVHSYSYEREVPTYGETAGNIKMIAEIVTRGTIKVPWEKLKSEKQVGVLSWLFDCFTELPVHTPRKRTSEHVLFFFSLYVIKVGGGFPWIFTSAPANLVSLRGLPPVVRRLPSDIRTYGYADNQAALIHAWSPRNQSPITNYVLDNWISNTKRQYIYLVSNKRLVNCETNPSARVTSQSTPHRMS